jgi:hypothetical protein
MTRLWRRKTAFDFSEAIPYSCHTHLLIIHKLTPKRDIPILTFTLANCVECRERYALMPSPIYPEQWTVFPRDTREFVHPSHLCSGDLLCLKGHRLRVTQAHAVLSENGDWLPVGVAPTGAAAN